MAVKDPYAVPAAGFKTPNFSFPSYPKEPNNPGYQMSPEELDKLLAQGYTIYEDGSIAPPAGQAPAGDTLPPPPEMASEASTWDNPIFGAHMAIRNPQPAAADPIADMQKQQRKVLQGDAAKPALTVSASPLPSPDYQQADETQKPGMGSQSMMQSRLTKRMGQQPLPPRGGKKR